MYYIDLDWNVVLFLASETLVKQIMQLLQTSKAVFNRRWKQNGVDCSVSTQVKSVNSAFRISTIGEKHSPRPPSCQEGVQTTWTKWMSSLQDSLQATTN
jgi:hypothetical protein